jgi:hypothetical protein
VVRIAITQAAYEATSATLPLGSVAVEPYFNAKGEGEICWMRSGSTGSGRCGRIKPMAMVVAAANTD